MSKLRSRPSLADLCVSPYGQWTEPHHPTRFCALRGGNFVVGQFSGVRHIAFCPPSGEVVGLCAKSSVAATDEETDVVTCKRCILMYLDGGFRRRGEAPWWEHGTAE